MADLILPLFPCHVPNTQTKRLKPTEAAYVAGLLDGEGYFSHYPHTDRIHDRRYTRAQSRVYKRFDSIIELTMTNKALIQEIASLIPWGSGTIWEKKRTLKGRARPAYGCKWTGGPCYSLCRAILPYARLKRPQIQLLLSVAEAKKRAYAERGDHGKYPAWLYEYSVLVNKQIRVLNQRGQDNAK